MSVQSLALNSFTDEVQKVSDKSLKVILDTIDSVEFPGTQLYIYFRMNTVWEDAPDLDAFIRDTAFIFTHQLPLNGSAEKLLGRYFKDSVHIKNSYEIIKTAWEGKRQIQA